MFAVSLRKGRIIAALLLAPLAAPVLFLSPVVLFVPAASGADPGGLAAIFVITAAVAYALSWAAFVVLAPLLLALRIMRPLPAAIAAGGVGVAFWFVISAGRGWGDFAYSFSLGAVPGYLLCRIGFPADRREFDYATRSSGYLSSLRRRVSRAVARVGSRLQ